MEVIKKVQLACGGQRPAMLCYGLLTLLLLPHALLPTIFYPIASVS